MSKDVYLDIETTGLNPFAGEICVISVNGEVHHVYRDRERGKAILRKHVAPGDILVLHNAQFDLLWLYLHYGFDPVRMKARVFDTMVAYQVLTAGQNKSAALKSVVGELLPRDQWFDRMDKTHQSAGGWDGLFLTPEQYQYASMDTKVLRPLRKRLSELLSEARLWRIFRLEMDILPVLVYMTARGVYVDVDAASELVERVQDEAQTVLEEGIPEGLNPRSPKQLTEYFNLQDATEDTLKDALRRGHQEHEALSAVLRYKKLTKKASYVREQIIERVQRDGRLHPAFTQTRTATGRFSCKDPNLQQVDRGGDVRGLFCIPDEGRRLIVADYAQLELRLAAYLSRDKGMIEAYRAGRDLHSETCARVFGEETKSTRTLSKNLNFSLVYGGSYKSLQTFAAKSDVILSDEEAKTLVDAFRGAYPTLVKWQRKQGNPEGGEYVFTPYGRRRYVPKGEGYNTRINTPVQGCGADGMKLAIRKLYYTHGVIPALTVHDELVVECGAHEAEDVRTVVEEAMVEGMYDAMVMPDPANPVVPIEVEGKVARSWAEK